MNAGDCVLQPPEIRHRVLESSDAFKVLEIGCPAIHETFADQALDLPNEAGADYRLNANDCFVLPNGVDYSINVAKGLEII